QFFLSRLLEGRDETVDDLRNEIMDLEDQLTVERDTNTNSRIRLTRLNSDLRSARADRDDLESELAEVRTNRDLLDQRVSLLNREREERAQELNSRSVQINELAAATLGLEEALDAASEERELALEQVEQLQQQIQALSLQLVDLDAALASKQGEINQQNQVIEDLGTRLNVALADRVEELSQYRSDFFGRLRQVLSNQQNVEIVGDRFVLQSEVLFETGEAELGPAGRAQLRELAATFRAIAAEIPDELPWVLQVDGHTDKRPINTPQFPSNWELSTARAIEVARYFTSQGIPPERVAARGFAEFQPLDPQDTEEAYLRNRRIELKLTTR
ncbi:MAG: peptidoglycan -binding protein, partial [Pseudomonadota bacterium]